jgi:prepilin-type N-terminal cleavage/methylation domain-containing protein
MLTKMLKKRSNEKGFTLMEMLIVVAIIAILIAIAIPTFNHSLNKAKLATDEANIRSGYAAVAAKVLTDKVEADTTYTLNTDGSIDGTGGTAYTCQGKAETDDNVMISGQGPLTWAKGAGVTYSYVADTGVITIKVGTTTTH